MTDLTTSLVTESTNLIPRLPDGFKFILAPGNVIVAVHPEYSTHYLNEKTMQWRVLDVHVSEVAKDART
jgi:hypothetical protein